VAVGTATGVGAEDAGGDAVTGGGVAAAGVPLEPVVVLPELVVVLAALEAVLPALAGGVATLGVALAVLADVLADVALLAAVPVAVLPDFALVVAVVAVLAVLAVVEVVELEPSPPQPASARMLAARNHCGKLIVRREVIMFLENQHWRAPRYYRPEARQTCLGRATSAPRQAAKRMAIPCGPSLRARAILANLTAMPPMPNTQQARSHGQARDPHPLWKEPSGEDAGLP